MTTDKLEPCPFCNDSSYPENVNPYSLRGYWVVRCSNCESEGPAENTEFEAIAAWNRRAPVRSLESARSGEAEPDTSQDWEKLDGAVAYHLIERHGEDWADIGAKMEAWGKARFAAPQPAAAIPSEWREFIERVAKQKPEKPDYWSSCSQCEHNISDAEDLLEAAPPCALSNGGEGEDHA